MFSRCLIHHHYLTLTALFGTGCRDYTHGLITAAIYIVPMLRTDTEDAAIASNCVLNTGAFGGDDEFIHVSRFVRAAIFISRVFCSDARGLFPSSFLGLSRRMVGAV